MSKIYCQNTLVTGALSTRKKNNHPETTRGKETKAKYVTFIPVCQTHQPETPPTHCQTQATQLQNKFKERLPSDSVQSLHLPLKGLAFTKMSFFAFDPELEQKLNDIDEFIKSQCGEELTAGFDQSEWLLPSQAGEAPTQLSYWNVKGSCQNFVHIRHLRRKDVILARKGRV